MKDPSTSSPLLTQSPAQHYLRSVWLQRGLFWIAMTILIYVLDNAQVAWYVKVINAVTLLFCYWAIVRINFEWLISRYLHQKRFFFYLLWLSFFALSIALIRIAVTWVISNSLGTHTFQFWDSLSGAFISLILVGCISSGIKIFSDWLAYTRMKSESDKQQMQSELQFLRSQVNPHFLFNTLNSLYALTLKKSDKAPELVIKLSDMMRYMLYECNVSWVPLDKELNYVKHFVELGQLRLGDRGELTLNISGDPKPFWIAPLIFLPFIENAFKHGMDRLIDDAYLHIDISIEDSGDLYFHVKNSTLPYQTMEKDKRSGGIGLSNVRRRLELVYPDQHRLTIKSADDCFEVDLFIHLIEDIT